MGIWICWACVPTGITIGASDENEENNDLHLTAPSSKRRHSARKSRSVQLFFFEHSLVLTDEKIVVVGIGMLIDNGSYCCIYRLKRRTIRNLLRQTLRTELQLPNILDCGPATSAGIGALARHTHLSFVVVARAISHHKLAFARETFGLTYHPTPARNP